MNLLTNTAQEMVLFTLDYRLYVWFPDVRTVRGSQQSVDW